MSDMSTQRKALLRDLRGNPITTTSPYPILRRTASGRLFQTAQVRDSEQVMKTAYGQAGNIPFITVESASTIRLIPSEPIVPPPHNIPSQLLYPMPHPFIPAHLINPEPELPGPHITSGVVKTTSSDSDSSKVLFVELVETRTQSGWNASVSEMSSSSHDSARTPESMEEMVAAMEMMRKAEDLDVWCQVAEMFRKGE